MNETEIKAWRQRLECNFEQIDHVFEACLEDALANLSPEGVNAWLDGASLICLTGRGVEPVLSYLEEMPEMIGRLGDESLLEQVARTAWQLSRSTNGRSIPAFLQTLGEVSRRLGSAELMGNYCALVLEFAQRTSTSIHGNQNATFPSPSLTDLLERMPQLLHELSCQGLRNWIEYGLQHYLDHPERQRDYFCLQSADSRAVLHRERHGTLFIDHERKLHLYLQALWEFDDLLVPYSSAFDQLRKPMPYYDDRGIRVPDVYDDLVVEGLPPSDAPPQGGGEGDGRRPAGVRADGRPHQNPEAVRSTGLLPSNSPPHGGGEGDGRRTSGGLVISGLDRYRALLAHIAAHKRWSTPQVADNYSPFQRLAIETFEDCRVEQLALRRYPGLRRLWLALHPKPAEDACDPETESCIRHRLAMFSRATLDPDHGYRNPDLLAFVERFFELLEHPDTGTAEVAALAISYIARTRRQADLSPKVHFRDTEVPYRDDNRHLWIFIEEGDEEEAFDKEQQPQEREELDRLPPRHYPEWDYQAKTYRPDWVSLYEGLHPSGDPAYIDALLARHQGLAKQLRQLLDRLKPQQYVRVRYQEEGSELDLDVAIRSLIDFKGGAQPDPRINMSHRHDGRDIAVTLLLDLSESLNQVPEGADRSILQLSQEAVSLLAWAIEHLGDEFAIAGFNSDTRHEVRYQHIKGFTEHWDDTVKARLAAMQAGLSTRMGAAMRHAGHYLAPRKAEKRLLLILTDGEPHDVDEQDPRHLIEDARRAVHELDQQGIFTFCVNLDPQADSYVQDIFGQAYTVIDRVERLPEKLPRLFLSLTR